MELKCHIDGVSAAYVQHYRQFNDSLSSLHFILNDIDAAAKLVLDMNSSNNCGSYEEYRNHLQKFCFIVVGSLKNALKINIEHELYCRRTLCLNWKVEKILFFYKGGKLALSNRALAKFIIGYKKRW